MQLKGAKGFAALQVYNSMIPFFATVATFNTHEFLGADKKTVDIDKIITAFKEMDDNGKKMVLLEAMQTYPLNDSQVINLLRVHKDKNGAAISPRSIDNFSVSEIMKMVLDTCVECSNIDTALFF